MEQKTKGKFFHRTSDDTKTVQIVDETHLASAKGRPSVTKSHLSGLNGDIDHGLEETPGEYLMAPTATNDLDNLNPLEVEARAILSKLGINDDMLYQAINSGPRSDIMGAYRIVIHRLQKQRIHALQAELTPADEQPSIPKNNHRICAIL